MPQATWIESLRRGVVIPATPLALTAARKLDERRQRALYRYYAAAGAGGLAVGVHTTQFEIREPRYGLLRPVLALAAEEMDRADSRVDKPPLRRGSAPLARIAGICGQTKQAAAEATQARELRYHAGLLSLAALPDASEDALIAHCRTIAGILPIIGFYLQPAAGGRILDYGFWRRFAEIENVLAIKIAPFNRYRTIDVVRAVAESGREDIALYTGNDDNIVLDLLTPFRFKTGGRKVERRIVGGLLGHWAVWTSRAVELLEQCRRASGVDAPAPAALLRLNVEVTDMNAVVFDAANGFAGCISGVHEVLRQQGLLEGIWCLDPKQALGPGQAEEIQRVKRAYPHLIDDDLVAEYRDEWLR
jgi:dihydrodipicolinate synthase/N-acetylneuraminate lyase